jgi:hypothetical protein
MAVHDETLINGERPAGLTIEKGGPIKPPSQNFAFGCLQYLHVFCLPPLGTFNDTERNRLAFFQAAETIGLNGGEVYKNIFTVFPGEKAVTLRVIEPLHCSLFHISTRIPCLKFAPFLRLVQGRLQGVQLLLYNAFRNNAAALYPWKS